MFLNNIVPVKDVEVRKEVLKTRFSCDLEKSASFIRSRKESIKDLNRKTGVRISCEMDRERA